MKKSFKINDLKSVNFGISSNFGILSSRAQYFDSYTEEGEIDQTGASVDTAEFLASQEEIKEQEVLIKMKNVLEMDADLLADLDPEIVKLYAEQKLDLEEAPNAYSNKEPVTKVTVTLERKSLNGNWFTITDKKTGQPSFEITMDLEDLFDVEDNGRSLYLKSVNGKSIIDLVMDRHFIDKDYCYSYINKENGEMMFVSQAQRFMLKSSSLKAGVVVEGIRLEATVAPFFHKYDLDNNEVYEDITSYGRDNTVEVNEFVVIIPSTADESNGDAADTLYSEGIMYGTSEATQAMMSDDMADDAIRNNRKEEARIAREGKKARRASLNKKDLKNAKDMALLNSELGLVVAELVELSNKAKDDRKLELEVDKKLSELGSQAAELMEIAYAYKRVHGQALAYKTWQKLDAMIKIKRNKEFAGMVESHILENIANLNNGSLTVADLDDESLIEVRETSVAFGKKTKACWIVDSTVSNQIKQKYAQVKGVKVS